MASLIICFVFPNTPGNCPPYEATQRSTKTPCLPIRSFFRDRTHPKIGIDRLFKLQIARVFFEILMGMAFGALQLSDPPAALGRAATASY